MFEELIQCLTLSGQVRIVRFKFELNNRTINKGTSKRDIKGH